MEITCVLSPWWSPSMWPAVVLNLLVPGLTAMRMYDLKHDNTIKQVNKEGKQSPKQARV